MPIVEITTAVGCKNTCSYCPQDKFVKAYAGRSSVSRMSVDTFKICLDKIPKQVDMHFSGMCEPWLNPRCTDMVLYAHRNKHKILVSTTLTGMSLPDIDLLEPIPFKIFAVHLPSADGYENIQVDENYIKLLDRLLNSGIKATYSYHGQDIHPKLKSLIRDKAFGLKLITRAGNLGVPNTPWPVRLPGSIRCIRDLQQNILLPNADVILCCMDYGIKHVLGNLLTSDYNALFKSEEFLKIKKGMKDESRDILCRYCDGCARGTGFMFNITFPARMLVRLFRKLLGGKFNNLQEEI